MHYKKLLAAVAKCREQLEEIEAMIHEGADLAECIDKTFVALTRCMSTAFCFDSQERDG